MLCTALLLLACSGTGSTNPVAVPAPCTPAPVTLQIEGDSISLGHAAEPASTPAALLRAAFPGTPVVATGHDASTTADRIDGGRGYAPFPQGIVGNVYLTEFGVAAAALGEPLALFKANLRRIAAVPGAVLITPTPTTAYDIAPYAQAVREVSAELRVPLADAHAYVLALPNWPALLIDGVHPGNELYRLMYADVVVPVVARSVAVLRCR